MSKETSRPLSTRLAPPLRSRIHLWSYGYRKTLRLNPQRGYLADFADSELTW